MKLVQTPNKRTFTALWMALVTLLHSVRFYAQVYRDSGIEGLRASYSVWRASRDMAQVYGHIEREIEMHEEQMAYLRAELQDAQLAHRTARIALNGLYGVAR